MDNWVCSHCNASAYYDGRCGDPPILMCGCDKSVWIDDGRGGYPAPTTDAKPVKSKGLVSVKSTQTPEEVAAYWTPERMAAAQPVPMPNPVK